MDTVFNKIDSYNRSFLGFNPIGVFSNIHTWRRYLLLLVLTSAVGWVFLGWESTWNQVSMFFQYLPALILRQISTVTFSAKVSEYYGIGQHLSTAVIYGVCFILLSIYLEKINVVKSMNFFFSTSLSFMSIGIYEIIYNILYSNLQNQPWTFTFTGHQGLNLDIFVFFIFIGVVSLIYLYTLHYKPQIGKLTLILICCSIVTYVLWVYFPFPTSTLTVGSWTSANLFPQTMYAVGGVGGSGVPYYVPNNFLHLVNVLNKVFMAFTVLSFAMVRSSIK